MEKKTFSSSLTSTTIGVHGGKIDLLNKLFDLLKQRGFVIQTDRKILQEYPILADSHWEGAKGDLLFKSKIYPAGFSFEFYQEVNTKNPNGGYYDFEKFEMMPYLVRCEFLLTRKYMCQLIEQEDFENIAKPNFKFAIDKVMHKIKSCWHYEEGKELPEFEHPSYNATDKNGKQLRSGQVKYFYGYDKRLMRGVVYHNINNMWWVVINKYEYRNVASFQLFDIEPGNMPSRRIKNKRMPQRVRTDKLREKFKALGLTYAKLNEDHIQELCLLIKKELELFNSDMKMKLSKPRKKDIKVLKRTGLQYAVIEVDGYYFSRREAITFSSSGFIGFAGWASDGNVTPFANAFETWVEQLSETIEAAA